MIPDEAVEAAAKAAYEVQPVELFGEDGPVTWEQLSGSIIGNSRKWHEIERAKRALEAAAPHMLTDETKPGMSRKEIHSDLERVRAVRDRFEPGSVVWLVNQSMATAYENVLGISDEGLTK